MILATTDATPTTTTTATTATTKTTKTTKTFFLFFLIRVTPSEDPFNPITKESSTGCWVHICQRVNDLQDHKKDKVTISGTERFGLLEPAIITLLESLPNAEKCSRYKFKQKQQGLANEEIEFE